MTDTNGFVKEILDKLEGMATADRKEWAAGNFPTALRVIGVEVPNINEVVKDLAKRLRKVPGEEVVELAKALADTGILECYQVACKLLEKHRPATAALRLADVEALAQGLDNWVSVDNFAGLIAGPAWREGQIPDKVVREWAGSEERWWRRAAVVCTVALNQKARGGSGDAARTLDICRLVASDEDDMVAKALSWALRELAKRDAGPVLEFLEEHEDELPARVKREVRKKIETGRKP